MNVMPLSKNQYENQPCIAEYILGPAVDCSSQAACLPCQMELEVQMEQMLECFSGDFADGPLTDICEDGVEQFAEKCCPNASGPI